MRTLKFTDPSENYEGFGYFKLKVDTISTSADNCTIYEIDSDTLDICREAGLYLPVPFVTSIGALTALANSLGLKLEDEEIETAMVDSVELPDSVTLADVSGKAGAVIDLLDSLSYLPNTEGVGESVESALIFTVDESTEGEVIATINGTTLTLVSEGATTIHFETVGKYGQKIVGSCDLTISAAYPDTVVFTEASLAGAPAETIDLLSEITSTPDNQQTEAYVEENTVFTSSDPLVATVDGSILTLVGAGSATISLSTSLAEGEDPITDTITLTVA